MSAALDGPRIPAAAGRTSQLVVFLHGYGADGNDLIDIGRQWRALMPGSGVRLPPRARALGGLADGAAMVRALQPPSRGRRRRR